jgi:hypothetical protein
MINFILTVVFWACLVWLVAFIIDIWPWAGRQFRKVMGWYHLRLFGWCPSCKYEAPECDTCEVCGIGLICVRDVNNPKEALPDDKEMWKRFAERDYR